MSQLRVLALALLLPALAACDPGVTDFSGLLTGALKTGLLAIKIHGPTPAVPGTAGAASAPADATGTLTLIAGGAKIELAGTYTATTGALALTGTSADGPWSLTGMLAAAGFTGTFTGPGDSGTFSLVAGGAATRLCGTYEGDATGRWNVVATDEVAIGSHCDARGCGVLTGTVDGTTLTLVNPDNPEAVAQGTRTGDSVTGTWTSGDESGTWSGTSAGCDVGPVVPVPDPVAEVLVGNLTDPFDLAVDATHVYYFSGGDLFRCPQAGCTSPEKLLSAVVVSSGVAAGGGRIFWTSWFNKIESCDPSGGTCTPALFHVGPERSYPTQLTVVGDRLYWTTDADTSRRFWTCPLSGCTGEPTSVLDSPSQLNAVPLSGLAIGPSHMYVSSYHGPIFRFGLTAPDRAEPATFAEIGNAGSVSGSLFLDGARLYVVQSAAGKLATLPAPDGGTLTPFWADQKNPGGLDATAGAFFWTERGESNPAGGYVANTGTVRRLAR